MSTPPSPIRLHVLLAQDAPSGIIIGNLRHGDHHYSCTIGWNRANDTFELGQWLKAKIYGYDCDLSPDGKHFLYFVANYHGSWKQEDSTSYGNWTAISRVPYLKAVVFRGQSTTHCRGGHFVDNSSFWMNCSNEEACEVADGLNWVPQPPSQAPWALNTDGLYDLRMRRSGWQAREMSPDGQYVTRWQKKQNAWTLDQFSHYYLEKPWPVGRGPFWQQFSAQNTISGETLGDQSWEWADFDEDRLVWAQGGKLFATKIWDGGHGEIVELADFNGWHFKSVQAPY